MRKKILITIILILVIGFVTNYYWLNSSDQELEKSDEIVFIDPVSVPDETDESPITPEPHPVSLPALMKKEFDGRDLSKGQILDNNSAYTRYYIEYLSGELTISGIMNVPKGDGPWPVLILNHGYIDPAVYTNGRGLKREQDYLARRGYIVIHPDYRNHAGSSKDPNTEFNFRLGYTEDVINLIMAIKESELDIFQSDNIGLLGHSMGGGIALNVMVIDPSLVKAVVLFAPVNALARYNFDRWVRRREDLANQIVEAYGSPEDSPEFWDNLSPATFFDRVEAPVLLHHGDADKDVPLLWSEELEEWMKTAGKDIIFHVYKDEPHEFTSAWPQVMERTVGFFAKNLDLSPKI